MSTVVKGCGLGLVFLATSGGCVQTSAGSSPSATSPEPASAESETPGAGKALLLGAVRLIDGADAPNTGEPIEVAAGCHVIQTSEDLLVVLTEGEVRGRITPAQIVVVMKPGCATSWSAKSWTQPRALAASRCSCAKKSRRTGRFSCFFRPPTHESYRAVSRAPRRLRAQTRTARRCAPSEHRDARQTRCGAGSGMTSGSATPGPSSSGFSGVRPRAVGLARAFSVSESSIDADRELLCSVGHR